MRALLQGSAQVGGSQRDDVPDAPNPLLVVLIRLMRGAARHQAAHRVADQRDLPHVDGPRLH